MRSRNGGEGDLRESEGSRVMSESWSLVFEGFPLSKSERSFDLLIADWQTFKSSRLVSSFCLCSLAKLDVLQGYLGRSSLWSKQADGASAEDSATIYVFIDWAGWIF